MEFINVSMSNILNIGIFIYISSKLFDPKLSRNRLYVIFILEFICLCFINKLNYLQFNTVIVLLTNTILLLLCFRGKLAFKIYITFVYVCYGTIMEMLSFILIHYLFNVSYDSIGVDSLYYLIGTLFSSISLFLILSLFSKSLTSLSDTKYPRKTLLLLCLPVTSMLFITSIRNLDDILMMENTSIILTFIGLLFSNILSFYIFFDIIEIIHENTDIKLKKSFQKIDELNYQILENKYDSTRKFVHDMKKHMNIISGLLDLKDFKELSIYIHEFNKELEKTNYFIQTNQKILNIVINQQINKLKKENIRLKLDIDRINMSFLTLYEQNLLYGNLIENAIESCVKCPYSRNIIIKLKTDKNHIALKLINSCINATFINGILKTSKPNVEEHGYGLKKIQNIVDKHNGTMITRFNTESHSFYTAIIFPIEVQYETN